MIEEFEIEMEMAGNGWVYFYVPDLPELKGYPVVLRGDLCNALGILGKAKFKILERDNAKDNLL